MVTINTERKLIEIAYEGGEDAGESITVEATGSAADVHTTGSRPNSGLAVLSYPHDFVGSSSVRVLDADGAEIDSGEISVS